MGQYNFKKDLAIAKGAEMEVANLLMEKYKADILSFQDTGVCDIVARIRGKVFTFEVKEDFMCGKTGNIAVEFSCRGNPSGIETSKADYYIYKLHRGSRVEFVLHKTSVIKDMITKGLFRRIVNGGDTGSNSLNYLFKYEIFMRTGKVISIMP